MEIDITFATSTEQQLRVSPHLFTILNEKNDEN